MFTVHTDTYDKQLGAVIGQNNKPIDLLYMIINTSQRNLNKTEKQMISIVEFQNQFRGILIG